MAFIEKALDNSLHDPRGQWLLEDHREAQAEWALTAVIEGKIKMVVIDRTFIDEQGIRWLIDYKTAVPGEKSVAAFLHAEKEKYASKMQDYQQALHLIDPQRPICVGLYFPRVPAGCEWAAVLEHPTTSHDAE